METSLDSPRGPIGLSGSLYVVLSFSDFWPLRLYHLSCGRTVGRINLSVFFLGKTRGFLSFFFQMSLALRGNDFNFFSSTNKAKMELIGRKWAKKSTLLPDWHPRCSHFVVRKSRFLDFFNVFLELFGKCLSIVFGLRRPTFGRIFIFKSWYMTPKIEIFGQKYAHFGGFKGSFLTILRVEKVGFWTFSNFFWVVWEVFMDCFRL